MSDPFVDKSGKYIFLFYTCPITGNRRKKDLDN